MSIYFYSETWLPQLLLLLLAFALSAVIGLEREVRSKSAGLRTYALVGIGSAVFTLVSAYGFASVTTSPAYTLDPSRIAAQIVSGIGFLGAGVIFVRRNSVNGLTTAAAVWVTAAIGMACGAGMPILAIAATALHLITVWLLHLIARRRRRNHQSPIVVLRYRMDRGGLRVALATATSLGYEASLLSSREVKRKDKRNLAEVNLRFSGDTVELDELLEQLAHLKPVTRVSLQPDHAAA